MTHRDRASSLATSTRRRYLQVTGGAVTSLAFMPVPRAWAAAGDEPSRAKPEIPFQLGLASYTLRKFDLDRALAMTSRAGLNRICLKSMHLPLDAKPAEIAAVIDKCKRAGLVVYGGGVITMKTERDIVQALEYAKAAGMGTITAAPIPEVLPILDERI